MKKTNILIIGGFLGAGKTTSILAIAKHLISKGKKIGIITNDQGTRLVDTEFLKHQGLDVLEVTGGCFCCNFNKLADRIAEMSRQGNLDYILAEPVGSCTDLVATIMKPFKDGKCGDYSLLPLSVIIDPLRLKSEIFGSEKYMPGEVGYLILKQLEEADILVVNKKDLMTDAERVRMTEFLNQKYPGKEVLFISALKNSGIEEWLDKLSVIGRDIRGYSNHSLNIQYDVYAKAEADLGWLNSSCDIHTRDEISADKLLRSLSEYLKADLKKTSNEIAHMKLFIKSRKTVCKLSCISVFGEDILEQKHSAPVSEGELIINIRANIQPDRLRKITETVLFKTLREYKGEVKNLKIECFSPSYPKPVYRYL